MTFLAEKALSRFKIVCIQSIQGEKSNFYRHVCKGKKWPIQCQQLSS